MRQHRVMTTDLDAVRRDLTAKQGELDTELATLSAPAGDPGDISFGKRVGDGTSMAVERLSQVAAHEQLQDLRADVVRALAKIDEGSYGVCDRCGQPIAAGRLEALPWTALCIDDASKR